jgi:cyclic pyranopterin phosphate synthase
MAPALRDAGLGRVNVSLVSLDPETYSSATRGGNVADVLSSIDAALDAGLEPVKINVVMMRSLRQDPLQIARLSLDRPLHVRFIEYMPVGAGGEDGCDTAGPVPDWTEADRIPNDEVLARLRSDAGSAGLGQLVPLEREDSPLGWGPARYFRFEGAAGTVGTISALSHMFCADCNRLRLTADGRLRTCLFADEELDARRVLREGADADLRALVLAAVAAKPESHHLRVGTIRRMSQVGG